MTNRTKSSDETITDSHTLHISDTMLPLHTDRYYLKKSELCKIYDTKCLILKTQYLVCKILTGKLESFHLQVYFPV